MLKLSFYILIAALLLFAVNGKTQPPHVLLERLQAETGKKNIQAALPLSEALVNAVKKQLPHNDDSLDYYFMWAGYALYNNGFQVECIPFYKQALPVKKKLLGEDHAVYQELLNSLAYTCFANRKFDEAAPLYEAILNYRSRKFDHNDSMYINAVFMMANVIQYQGRKQEAMATYHQLKKWYDKRNIRSLDYVNLLLWLGQVQFEVSEFKQAEATLNEAKTICAAIDANNPFYYQVIHFLGLVYIELGMNSKAAEYYDVLLHYYKHTTGREHDYASALSEMASVQINSGKYAQAEEMLKESLKIRQQYNALPEHIANSYNELANLYLTLGNYPLAETSLREALAIRGKSHGKDKVYATYLHNIAVSLTDRNNYAAALPLEKEAADIYSRFNDNDPGYMQSLANVAYDLVNLGRFGEGEEYLNAAITVSKKLVADHPHLYELYMLAGIFKQEVKDYKAAAGWYLKGHELNNRLYGKGNDKGSALNRLTNLYLLTGNYNEAYKWQQQKNEVLRRKVATGLGFLSEAELVNLSAANNFTDGPALLAHHGNLKEAASMLYDNLLFIKGLALNNNSAVATAIHASGDTSLIHLWHQTNTLKKLAYEQEQLSSDRRSLNVDSLVQLANSNEKLLVKRSQQGSETNAFTTATWRTVQQQLDSSSSAIEFVRYKSTTKGNDSAFYAALVITKSAEAPVFVKLCSEGKLMQLLNKFSKNGGDLYSRGLTIKNSSKASSSRELFDLVWKPLQQHLKDISNIYFSPDGLLHRIAFAALPANDSISLLHQYRFTQLFSTRTAGMITGAAKPKDILLMGGINFDEAIIDKNASERDPLGFVYNNRSADMAEYKFLPGTLQEVNSLSALAAKFGIANTTISGSEATEAAFRTLSAKGPGVIHISTHGFSLPEDDAKKKVNNSFSAASDPLVRCGLIMAGGNTAWKNKFSGSGYDGILTGKELSTLNLRGCGLAVLSACETGLGNIQGTEGVFGLQRALKTAGVQSVIVSLWPVPDKETVEFMEVFYSHWFSNGDKQAAFHHAQLQMQQKYNASLWAAFVLIQ